MKPLRIAMFVTDRYPLSQQTKTFAPIWINNEIALGMKKRGHAVTLFASKDSRLPGVKIVSGGLVSLQTANVPVNPNSPDSVAGKNGVAKINKTFSSLYDQAALTLLYSQAQLGKFDIIHVHPIDLALPLAHMATRVPTLATLHDPLQYWRKVLHSIYIKERGVYYVSISHSQRRPLPKLNYVENIYHGVNLSQFKFSKTAGNYFVHVARITPEKGTHIAALAARQTGVRLKIVGEITHPTYFENQVKPLLNSRVQYVGFKRPDQIQKIFAPAKGLILPLQWDEPFGLVMIEAMACGTPVIAYPRGSAPEIVRPGITGFLPKNFSELKRSILKIETIDRHACRDLVEQHFSIDRMVDDYERTYYQVIKDYKKHASLS